MMAELIDFLNNITLPIAAQILIVIVLGFFCLNLPLYLKRAKKNKKTILEFSRNLFSKKEVENKQDREKRLVDVPSFFSNSFISGALGIQALITFILSVYAGFNGEKGKFLIGMFFFILLAIASKYFFVRSEEGYNTKKSGKFI